MVDANDAEPLEWDVLIRKRTSATRGGPPGREALKWVSADNWKTRFSRANPGHPGCSPLDPDHSPGHLAATRQYIQDFDRLDGETASATELYDRMIELCPDRIDPGSLWGAAHGAKAFAAQSA